MRRRKRALWCSFYKVLILFRRARPSWLKHRPKALPPNTITVGTKISKYEFGEGHKHSDHSNIYLQRERLRERERERILISLREYGQLFVMQLSMSLWMITFVMPNTYGAFYIVTLVTLISLEKHVSFLGLGRIRLPPINPTYPCKVWLSVIC